MRKAMLAGACALAMIGSSSALAGEADPLHARTGYDVALWIVSDLLDRGGIEAVRELLERLGAGETMAEAMPRIYGLHATELELQWRRVLGG